MWLLLVAMVFLHNGQAAITENTLAAVDSEKACQVHLEKWRKEFDLEIANPNGDVKGYLLKCAEMTLVEQPKPKKQSAPVQEKADSIWFQLRT
jgi:hypothetical protein